MTTPPSERYHWRNVEIVGGGFITGVTFHPGERDLLYARTDIGGAYRWNPRTRRWIPLQDHLAKRDWNLYGVESLALDPADPDRLYLAAGTYTNEWAGNGAILRSDDRGRTWRRTDMPFKFGSNENGRSMGERLAVDPERGATLLLGTRHEGLWRSDDRGAHWRQVERFPVTGRTDGIGVAFVLFHSSGVYACARARDATLWRSRDGGRTWTPLAGQPADLLPHHGAFDAHGTLYVTGSDGPGPNGVTDGAVWKWESPTGAWTRITPETPGGFGYAGVALDPQRPGTLWVSSLDRWARGDTLWRTTDGGKSWRSLQPHAVRDSSGAPYLRWGRPEADLGHWIGAIAQDPFRPGHVLYVTGATLWGSDDADRLDRGETTRWSVRAQGIEETAALDLVSPTAGPPLLSALGDIGGFRHDDLDRVPAPGRALSPRFNTTVSLDAAPLAPHLVVASGHGRPAGAISTDGGASWSGFASTPAGASGPGAIALSADGRTIFWAPQGARPSVSRDGGATWTVCSGPEGQLDLAADRIQPERLWAWDARSGTLWESADAGQTFVAHSVRAPSAGDGTLRTPIGAPGNVWISAGGNGLWRCSPEDGLSRLAGVTHARDIGFGAPRPGTRYPTLFLNGAVNGADGIFRSDDAGERWTQIDDAFHRFGTSNVICGDPRRWGRVFLGTNGRGILVAEPRRRAPARP